jgi:hypothetical protein
VLWQRGKREQRDALHRVYMKTSNNQARNPGLFTHGEETRQQAKAHLMLLHASLTSLLWFWGVFRSVGDGRRSTSEFQSIHQLRQVARVCYQGD